MEQKFLINEKAVSWNLQVGRLKRAYATLTDADLNYTEARKSEMVSSVSQKLGVTERSIMEIMMKITK